MLERYSESEMKSDLGSEDGADVNDEERGYE